MTSDEQLERWLEGDPVHNEGRDECCPDFSCCRPDLLVEREVREAFMQAHKSGNELLKHNLCMMFLTVMVGNEKVHIAGSGGEIKH